MFRAPGSLREQGTDVVGKGGVDRFGDGRGAGEQAL
jgi:hypothetical protein